MKNAFVVSVYCKKYTFPVLFVKCPSTSVSMLQELCDKVGSPLGSTGSVADSIKSESPAGSVPEDRKSSETGVFILLITLTV
jgi:hypothetical protein